MVKMAYFWSTCIYFYKSTYINYSGNTVLIVKLFNVYDIALSWQKSSKSN